jgi:hypothetical protein
VWFYSTVNDDTTPSPIRRLPKLATNCMIVRNSPWSAKVGRVVLGHLHTNYPDAKSGPDPSGQRARPGRQVMQPLASRTRTLRSQRDPMFTQFVVTGSVVSVVLLVVLMVSLQRFWKADLTAGATKGRS